MRARFGGWLFAALLVIAAGCIGYLTTRHALLGDWTAGARASLAPQSRAVLARLDGPVAITSYASAGSDLRPTVAAFIQRYRQFKPDLTLRFVDPEQDPAAMRKAGITVDGELVIRYRDREERVDALSESNLSDALERLARGGERIVAFVTGDGERRADGVANADLGTFIGQLEHSGVRAVALFFAEVWAVPLLTVLVVLASPVADVPPGAVKALVDYVQGGGNLLWLTEPSADPSVLAPLADALGVQVLPGVLVDGQGAALGLHDPRMVAVGQYPPHAITRGFARTTLFPEVAALAQATTTQWAVAPILRSGPQSWTELQPVDDAHPSTIRYDAAAGEMKGPLDFGFALSRLSPSPAKNEQRAVVIGDGDFLSNSFLGNGGNRAFGERVFDWLLGDDVLVDMPARGAPDRVLRLSQGVLDAITGLFLVAVPLLLLGIGLLVGWRRRRR
jgi:ABC-type uncharacterized transport system involved in gliding motility auxiliary subunit